MADGYEQLHEYLGPDGTEYRVSSAREEEFLKAVPDARRFARHVGKDGTVFRVGPDKVDSFRAENPDAEPVYPMRTAKGVESIRAREVAGFLSRMAPPDAGAPRPLRTAARAILAPLAGFEGAARGTAADVTVGSLARAERAKAERAAPERIPTMKEAGAKIGLSQQEIDALPDRPVTLRDLDDPRFPQGYRDSVRATMNRVAANAPETDAERAHRENAERLQARADRISAPSMTPENAVERFGMHVGAGAETMGELAAVTAAGGPAAANAWMAATAAGREAARQEAEGKSANEALRGSILPGIGEAAGWATPIHGGAGRTLAARMATEAAAAGTKAEIAGNLRRAASGEKAPELSERIAEDLGAAAFGAAAVGARAIPGAVRTARQRAQVRAAERAVSRLAEEANKAEALRAARERTARAEEARAQMEETTEREGEDPALYERIGEQYEAAERAEAERRRAADAERMARVAAEEELAGAVAPDVAPEEVPPQVPSRRTLASERAARAAQGDGPSRTPIEMPDTSQTPATESLPTTPEQIQERRRAQLEAMPPFQRNKHLGMKRYMEEFPERAAVIEAIGWDKFQKIAKKYGGDFRNVTGDLVPVGEISEATGRDYSGPDGVRRALEDAQAEADAWRAWREKGAPSAEEEMAEGQEILWNRGIQSEAQERYRERAAANSQESRDPTARDRALEEGEVERIEAEVRAEDAVAGSSTPPRDFALDGGTPAEIDAEKARAAETQKRAALEEAAAAPGRDLGTVSIQEGLPGIGGDGTLFTPPAGGWSGRRASGPLADAPKQSALLDAVKDAAAWMERRGKKPGTPAPEAAAGSPAERLAGMLAADKAAGDLPPERSQEYRALAEEAARAGLYRTAARALARIGEFKGEAFETLEAESGAPARSAGASSPEARRLLPEAEAGSPALQRLGVGDLVGFVKDALGQVPGVRRILMNGRALGLFYPNRASAALSGMRDRGTRAIEVMSKLYRVLPEGEKARIAQDAERAAAREARPDDTPADREARLARWTQKLTDEAWHRHLREGPTAAANVLAHEIGHFVDFLPDRDLGRGNILGHIAGMKKYLRNYLAIDPMKQPGEGAPDAALFPEKERVRIAKDARDAVSRLPGESAEAWKARRDEAAREAVGEEALRRGLARRADVEREIDDLVAWYNTSDGPPDYFKGNATERFAEAFSALVNYPEVARLKAPRLAKLMDEWAAARPEAARALVRARERAARLQARMIRTGKSQPDEGFFKELRESTAAQSEARRRISEIRREQGRWNAREFADWARAWFVGRFEPVFKRIREAGGWNDETAAKAWGSVNRLSHWANGGDLILYRWRSEVAPLVAKVKGGLEAFDEFLINWRVANEVLGEGREGGRVNLANPEGLTPGDFTGPHAEAGRTAAARLKAIRERDPEQWNALMAAREAFWKMRTDRDSSVIPALRRSGLMPESALRQLEANSAYVRFKRGVRASDYDPRPLASRAKDAMSTWSGVYRQVQGTHGAIESPTLATLMGDAEILRRVALNEARRDVAALMQKHFPNLVRPGMPAGRGGRVDQRMDRHMRTLVWSEDGKQRSLEVPRHIADALEDASAGLGGDAGGGPVVDALRSFARTESALMTAWNYGFAVKNVVRDKADMARAMPGKDWNSARNWLSNILGDFGAAAHSALQRAGRDRRLGRANLSVVEALESGAMPAGQGTAWATGKRFAEEVGDLLASADTADHERAVRAIMEAAGYDPSLRTEEGAVRKAARAFSKVYQKGLEVLSDQETNNKVQAMLEIRRAHPDWSPDRVAWYVQRYVGTPDPTDRPRITEYPVFNMLVPFWTMNVHGNHDQLVRLAAEQKGVQAARFAAHMAAKWAANFSAPMLLRWAARKREEGDEEAAAMAEDAAEMQRSIPIHDRLSGICIPLAWADRKAGKVWYVRIPSGQTVVPVDALVLGSQAAARKQTPWGDVADWSLGSMMPVNPGPPVKAAVGALSGVDIGTGFRKISAEAAGPGEIALDRALFFLRQLGVNGAGLANGKTPWAKGDVGESVSDLERALRAPGLNATLGSFLRVSNGGLKGEARVVDAKNRRRSARVTRASDRIAAGEGTDEDYATLYELSGDADRAVTNAERRRDRREEEPNPLRRALLRVPEEFRDAEAARHRMPSP